MLFTRLAMQQSSLSIVKSNSIDLKKNVIKQKRWDCWQGYSKVCIDKSVALKTSTKRRAGANSIDFLASTEGIFLDTLLLQNVLSFLRFE